MAEKQEGKRPIDFNDLFSKDELMSIPVNKCVTTEDNKIMACRTNNDEWMIESNSEKMKGRIRVTGLK
jgi:hypothetical protein